GHRRDGHYGADGRLAPGAAAPGRARPHLVITVSSGGRRRVQAELGGEDAGQMDVHGVDELGQAADLERSGEQPVHAVGDGLRHIPRRRWNPGFRADEAERCAVAYGRGQVSLEEVDQLAAGLAVEHARLEEPQRVLLLRAELRRRPELCGPEWVHEIGAY